MSEGTEKGFAGTVKAWAEAESENDELRAQLTSLMDAFNDQAAELEQAKEDRDSGNEGVMRLIHEGGQLEAQLAQMQKERDDQAAELEDLKGRLLAMDGRVLTAQDRVREAEATIEELRSYKQITDRDATIERLRAALEEIAVMKIAHVEMPQRIARAALTGKEQE